MSLASDFTLKKTSALPRSLPGSCGPYSKISMKKTLSCASRWTRAKARRNSSAAGTSDGEIRSVKCTREFSVTNGRLICSIWPSERSRRSVVVTSSFPPNAVAVAVAAVVVKARSRTYSIPRVGSNRTYPLRSLEKKNEKKEWLPVRLPVPHTSY